MALPFDSGADGYDPKNALGCARLSCLAYHPDKVNEKAVAWGFTRVGIFPRGHYYGFSVGSGDFVIVAFRGTVLRDARDWLTDFDALPMKEPWGTVHRGFMEAANLFWPELPERLKEFSDGSQTVWLTGHSLGGAIATLATARLAADGARNIRGLYTFGQPPVGDAAFGNALLQHLGSRYFRVVNSVDAVAAAEILSLRHVGAVRYFDLKEKLHERTPPRLRAMAERFWAHRKYGGLNRYRAHSIDEYVRLLKPCPLPGDPAQQAVGTDEALLPTQAAKVSNDKYSLNGN